VDVDRRPIPQDRKAFIDHDLNVGNGVEPPIVDVARHDPADVPCLGPGASTGIDQDELRGVQSIQRDRVRVDQCPESPDLEILQRSHKTHPRRLSDLHRGHAAVVIERLHLFFHPKIRCTLAADRALLTIRRAESRALDRAGVAPLVIASSPWAPATLVPSPAATARELGPRRPAGKTVLERRPIRDEIERRLRHLLDQLRVP
jgi:hypothetical protein